MSTSEIIIFTTDDGKVSINTQFDEETVWLSLDQMAELFDRSKSTISRHISNVHENVLNGALACCNCDTT